MAKIRSRLLVVDASIARAAGDVSTHPTSRRCREFLLAVLEVCHQIVMTAPIRSEWDKHQSRFARTWRLSMVARKKIKILESHDQRSLEKRFPRVVVDPFILAIMEKDRCLIEAALLSEKRIASLDDSVRTHFQNYRDNLPELRSICWVNPAAMDEDLCEWLRAGARIERSRTLGHLAHRQ